MQDDIILKLEKLSNLNLSTESREKIKNDLSKIISMIDKMSELDTSNVEPLTYVNEEPYVLRKDNVSDELSVEDALKNAPQSKNNFFTVPKVVKV